MIMLHLKHSSAKTTEATYFNQKAKTQVGILETF